MKNNSTLRISPFDQAQAVGVLPEGSILEIDQTHSSFYLVTSGNNLKGWIPKTDVEQVEIEKKQ